MLFRVPRALPTNSRKNGALYAWLNRLRDAVIAGQAQVPHNLQAIEGPNGVSYLADPPGRRTVEGEPDESEEEQDEFCSCVTGLFQVKVGFPGGGNGPGILFDLINAAATFTPDPTITPANYRWWQSSSFRLTRTLAHPYYISKLELTRDPTPRYIGTFGPIGVPFLQMGFPAGFADALPLKGFNILEARFLADSDPAIGISQPTRLAFTPPDSGKTFPQVVWGKFGTNAVESPGVSPDIIREVLDYMIPPGTALTVLGEISRWTG